MSEQLHRIHDSDSPTQVFRTMLSEDPNLSNHDLAWLFVQRFPEVGATANNFIWYWRSPARPSGTFDDALVDSELSRLLRDAGYK